MTMSEKITLSVEALKLALNATYGNGYGHTDYESPFTADGAVNEAAKWELVAAHLAANPECSPWEACLALCQRPGSCYNHWCLHPAGPTSFCPKHEGAK